MGTKGRLMDALQLGLLMFGIATLIIVLVVIIIMNIKI